ncbi:MAG: hypothetical protein HQL99_16425 [Magnetococcales bacterium]|nr:hypothetical protein [Magnetococcales bacterium]
MMDTDATTPPDHIALVDATNLHLTRALAIAHLLECSCGSTFIPKASMLEVLAGMLEDEVRAAQETFHTLFGFPGGSQ